MWANNETGIIFPVEEIAKIVKEKNPSTKVFVDGVQAGGKIKMNLADTEIDFVAIKLWWLTKQSIAVSKICASIIGALTVINGSFGNATVPSGIAQISPENLKLDK